MAHLFEGGQPYIPERQPQSARVLYFATSLLWKAMLGIEATRNH